MGTLLSGMSISKDGFQAQKTYLGITLEEKELERQTIEAETRISFQELNRKFGDILVILEFLNKLLGMMGVEIEVGNIPLDDLLNMTLGLSNDVGTVITSVNTMITGLPPVQDIQLGYPDFKSKITGKRSAAKEIDESAVAYAASVNEQLDQVEAGIVAAMAVMHSIKEFDSAFFARMTAVVTTITEQISNINKNLTEIKRGLTIIHLGGFSLVSMIKPYGDQIAQICATIEGYLAQIISLLETISGILLTVIGQAHEFRKLSDAIMKKTETIIFMTKVAIG